MSAIPGTEELCVLKLGSSVLVGEADLPRAVHQVYAELRAGRRVVVVVSALGDTTDQLLARSTECLPRQDDGTVARLLATGEARSAALLTLALERAGIPTSLLEAGETGILCEGAQLDARPVALDEAVLRARLAERAVVVLPGFVGRRVDGQPVLFGRGGSDLTAVFLAGRLGASRCVLLKDVDGLYEWDPADSARGTPRRLERVTFADAAHLADAGGIVQRKAVDHAAQAGVVFEVCSEGPAKGTVVGATKTTYSRVAPVPPAAPLRVGLLGLGTVGGGVLTHLAGLGERFVVTAALVREPRRHAGSLPGSALLTADPGAFFEQPLDVVVEAIGGTTAAGEHVGRALAMGLHVVTANKALLAADGEQLEALARAGGVQLRGSAAVGGGVPMLEAVQRLADLRRARSDSAPGDAGGPTFELEAVLNGTSSFVLDRHVAGLSIEAAVAEAQDRGLAESDPSLDLDGTDAAQKLGLLARVLFGGRAPVRRLVAGIEAVSSEQLERARVRGASLRLVARARVPVPGEPPELWVTPELLEPTSPLAGLTGAACGLAVRLAGHTPWALLGEGASRWPTAEAVVGDLLDLERDLAQPVEVLA